MQIVSLDENDVKLTVSSGLHTYEYTLSSNTATRAAKPAFELASLPVKRRWALLEDKRLMEFVGIAASVPAATGALSKISFVADRLTTSSRLAAYVVGAVVLATGGVAGYFTTYDDSVDYDKETFRKTLLDAASWRETARLLRDCAFAKRLAEIDFARRQSKPSAARPSDAKLTELRVHCSKIDAWMAEHL